MVRLEANFNERIESMQSRLFYGEESPYFEQALSVRHTVFTLEQGFAPEIDHDQLDRVAWHLLISASDQPIGTGRLFSEGRVAKIGRLAVIKERRGLGIGRKIVEELVTFAHQEGCFEEISLNAQSHATPFYEALGFIAEGAPFLEEGVLHIEMKRSLRE